MFENVTQNYTGGDATLEIVLMLAVAFVLGFLLRHIFCKASVDDEKPPRSAPLPPSPRPVMVKSAAQAESSRPQAAGEEPAGRKDDPPAGEDKPDATREPLVADVGGNDEAAPSQAGGRQNEAPVSAETKQPDDLRRIDGIGPKIAELLHADGIDRFAELASADIDRLKRILDAGGPRFRMHDPSTWPEQARMLAEGREADFEAWLASRRAMH